MSQMEEISQNGIWSWFKNNLVTMTYVILLIAFLIWMLFFDMNSYLVHRKLNKELDNINHKVDYYSKKFKEDSIQYNQLKYSREEREKYARENYFMKKKDEDIFIIVHKKDSVQ